MSQFLPGKQKPKAIRMCAMPLLNVRADDPGMDWEYFTPSPQCAPAFLPHADDAFELILVVRSPFSSSRYLPLLSCFPTGERGLQPCGHEYEVERARRVCHERPAHAPSHKSGALEGIRSCR